MPKQDKSTKPHMPTAYSMSKLSGDAYCKNAARYYARRRDIDRTEAVAEFSEELKSVMLDTPLSKSDYHGFILFDALQRIDWLRVAEHLISNAEKASKVA